MYADPTLPLVVDIGSGYGRFLLLLQRHNPDRPVNYLGIEIRRPVGAAPGRNGREGRNNVLQREVYCTGAAAHGFLRISTGRH